MRSNFSSTVLFYAVFAGALVLLAVIAAIIR